MPAPAASSAIEEAVSTISGWLDQGEREIALQGPPTSGKSTALEHLRERLGPNRRVIHVELPRRADDGAVVGALSAAAQLGPNVLSHVRNIRTTWTAKLQTIQEALQSDPDALVLIDEPRQLLREPTSSIFTIRTVELSRALLSSAGKWVVALDQATAGRARVLNLRAQSDPNAILAANQWNGLGEHAAQLLGQGSDKLSVYSPLELRLAVAVVAAGVDPSELVDTRWQPGRLINALMSRHRQGDKLKAVAGRLAVYRVPFTDEALENAGFGTLDDLGQKIVRSALLFGDGGTHKLHELIRARAAATNDHWLPDEQLDAAHRAAAQYHQRQFEQASDAKDLLAAVRHEVEMVHHLTEADRPEELDEAHVYFVEQFDALGKSLSLKKKYPHAVRAYERALAHDEKDSYAWHYLAYNLDVPGREPVRVEEGYSTAVELRPEHPLYEARYVCFLITRGRIDEAKAQWPVALASIFPESVSDDESLYRIVHGVVARLLLHRGEIEFAREVLDDVPGGVRHASWWQAEHQLWTYLKEASNHEAVFPPHIAIEKRWDGPHLIRDRDQRKSVKRWWPGRVSAVDPNGATHIRIAERHERTGQVEYKWLDLSAAEMKRQSPEVARGVSLPPGTFVEVVELPGKGVRRSHRLITAHPSSSYENSALLPLFPPPDRYIRAFTGSRS